MKSPLYLSLLQSSYTNQDAAIAAAAAEGARLAGQQITPPKIESTRILTSEFQVEIS